MLRSATPLSVLMLVATVLPVQGQLSPDTTLGSESSIVVPNQTIKDLPADLIQGGAARGTNLFHSFLEFNVDNGQRVYFANPSGIATILSRVTGSDVSYILGTLGVAGSADLFLLNPHGIIFGPNAQLDLQGSFVGTTANSIQFGDQWQFSTTNPEAPPLLTIDPSALLFNQLASQLGSSIAVVSNPNLPENDRPRLQVSTGESLILIGGNINPTNDATGSVWISAGQLFAPGGRIELGGLNSEGTVELVKNNGHWQTHFPTNFPRSSVILQNQAQLNVRSSGGGDIAIYANNFDLLSDSKLRAGIVSGLGSADTQAGDITIDALNQIQLTENSFISNAILDSAQGLGGNIYVRANTLNLKNTFTDLSDSCCNKRI